VVRPDMFRRKYAEQADRSIAHHNDGRAGLYVSRVGREPAGPEHIRDGGKVGGLDHQTAFLEWRQACRQRVGLEHTALALRS
jgi:hypothetical protein